MMKWELMHCAFEEVEAYLAGGWEPFAVDGDRGRRSDRHLAPSAGRMTPDLADRTLRELVKLRDLLLEIPGYGKALPANGLRVHLEVEETTFERITETVLQTVQTLLKAQEVKVREVEGA